MAKSMRGTEIHKFAVIGARQEIQRLQAEINRIKKQFGGRTLSGGTDPVGVKRPNEGPDDRTAPRKKRKLSAAGRKAISEAAKARWAKQRAGEASSSATSRKKK
jgi:hypothetical protein